MLCHWHTLANATVCGDRHSCHCGVLALHVECLEELVDELPSKGPTALTPKGCVGQLADDDTVLAPFNCSEFSTRHNFELVWICTLHQLRFLWCTLQSLIILVTARVGDPNWWTEPRSTNPLPPRFNTTLMLSNGSTRCTSTSSNRRCHRTLEHAPRRSRNPQVLFRPSHTHLYSRPLPPPPHHQPTPNSLNTSSHP